MFPLMSREDFFKEVRQWNIVDSDDTANFIVDSYFNEHLFNYCYTYFTKEEHTMEDIFLLMCDSGLASSRSQYGWVTPEGKMLYCQFATHDDVAEMFLGLTVGFVEKRNARITYSTKNMGNAIAAVEEQYITEAMLQKVKEHLERE